MNDEEAMEKGRDKQLNEHLDDTQYLCEHCGEEFYNEIEVVFHEMICAERE